MPKVEDDVDFSFHKQNYGESASDLLPDNRFKSLKVEIQYMDGFKPDKKLVINLKAFLIRQLNKPKGGTILFIKDWTY